MRRNFPDDPGSHPEGTRAAASNLQKIRKRPDPILVLKPEDWPSLHRMLWEAGTNLKGGRLARPKHADRLRPLSIRNARRGYGAFLAALRDAGIDIATPRPTDLATPENVARFVDALFARGNVPNSIGQRLFNLRTAFRIMGPPLRVARRLPGADRLACGDEVRPVSDRRGQPGVAPLRVEGCEERTAPRMRDASTPASALPLLRR